MAQPCRKMLAEGEVDVTIRLTIETRLKGSMFPSTSFSIILVDNQCPWLVSCLKALRHLGDRARRISVLVESGVNFPAFIIGSLEKRSEF